MISNTKKLSEEMSLFRRGARSERGVIDNSRFLLFPPGGFRYRWNQLPIFAFDKRENHSSLSPERDSPDIYNSRFQREMQSYFSENRLHASVQNDCRAFYPIDVYVCTSNARYGAAGSRKQRTPTQNIIILIEIINRDYNYRSRQILNQDYAVSTTTLMEQRWKL